MNSTCYDDSTKDHSGPAACQFVYNVNSERSDAGEENFNKSIDYLNQRAEYIRVIIIEWPTKSSITVAHIVSADIQCSLLSARRCENFDDYCQQVD
ncbi:unnamed protein product [Rotaria socialis]|uniref:Uncharacterized protein n=2 Tax=Rotaria socialis TaxID=392032 RepID=A0A821A2C2_9BILA|nr:unnamed protein product [Rotaria socialis]